MKKKNDSIIKILGCLILMLILCCSLLVSIQIQEDHISDCQIEALNKNYNQSIRTTCSDIKEITINETKYYYLKTQYKNSEGIVSQTEYILPSQTIIEDNIKENKGIVIFYNDTNESLNYNNKLMNLTDAYSIVLTTNLASLILTGIILVLIIPVAIVITVNIIKYKKQKND